MFYANFITTDKKTFIWILDGRNNLTNMIRSAYYWAEKHPKAENICEIEICTGKKNKQILYKKTFKKSLL